MRYLRLVVVFLVAIRAWMVRLAFAVNGVQNASGAVAGCDRGNAQRDCRPDEPPFAGDAEPLPRL